MTSLAKAMKVVKTVPTSLLRQVIKDVATKMKMKISSKIKNLSNDTFRKTFNNHFKEIFKTKLPDDLYHKMSPHEKKLLTELSNILKDLQKMKTKKQIGGQPGWWQRVAATVVLVLGGPGAIAPLLQPDDVRGARNVLNNQELREDIMDGLIDGLLRVRHEIVGAAEYAPFGNDPQMNMDPMHFMDPRAGLGAMAGARARARAGAAAAKAAKAAKAAEAARAAAEVAAAAAEAARVAAEKTALNALADTRETTKRAEHALRAQVTHPSRRRDSEKYVVEVVGAGGPLPWAGSRSNSALAESHIPPTPPGVDEDLFRNAVHKIWMEHPPIVAFFLIPGETTIGELKDEMHQGRGGTAILKRGLPTQDMRMIFAGRERGDNETVRSLFESGPGQPPDTGRGELKFRFAPTHTAGRDSRLGGRRRRKRRRRTRRKRYRKRRKTRRKRRRRKKKTRRRRK